ncbi:MAG: phosphatase PAP2 family protein [Chitinophagales bacterium]|nr:phosphatase PAP2 family protein [Chitinophagales bacterium]
MKIKFQNFLKTITLKILVVAVLFVASLFLFAVIADEAVLENENQFDQKIFGIISPYSTPNFVHVMEKITFFGSGEFLLPAYLLLASYLFIRKRFRETIDIAVVALSSTALTFALKQYFHRARPDLSLIKRLTTFSFPSGHTISSFILSFILMYVISNTGLKKGIKWLLYFLLLSYTLSVGLSRIVLHVHYPTDVLAGYCFALAWLIISFWALQKIPFTKIISNPVR